jgi:hypothetical protein
VTRIGGTIAPLALFVLGSACAGNGGGAVSPDEYARSACRALGDWVEGIRDLSSDARALDVEEPEKAQRMMVRLLGQAADRTGVLVDELDDAGTPDVEDGEKIARLVRRGFLDARAAFEDAQANARKLDATDPAFDAEKNEVLVSLDEAVVDSFDTFEQAGAGLETARLDAAFKEERACAEIRTGN